MLSADQLASMRATLLGSFPDTCQIGRYTTASDGGGGVTVTYPLDTAIPCRIGPNPVSFKGAEQEVAAEELGVAPWVIYLAWNTVIDEKDKILDATGRWYEVARVTRPRSWQIDVLVLCRVGSA